MALQVWLPFTQDLRNLGLNSISITNHNTTIVDGGKLGRACSFNGSSTYLEFSSAISFSNNFSICCWLDLTNINNTLYFVGFADNGGIRYGTDNTFLYFNDGQTLTYSFTKVNRFVHVAFTCASNSVKLYVDGTLIGSALTLNSALKNCTIIGKRVDGCYYNGKINDFRIYDHCLTPQEVKEISKGLVVHYTLNSNCLSLGLNLATTNVVSWNNGSATNTTNTNDTSYSNVPNGGKVVSIEKTNSSGESGVYLGYNVSIEAGHSYYCSCFVYFTNADTFTQFYLHQGTSTSKNLGNLSYNGNTNSSLWPRGKWIYVSGIFISDESYNEVRLCTYVNTNTAKKAFTGWEIREIGGTSSIVYDSSGYCNNGTISGTLSLDSNTPRYNKAILFPANINSSITTPLSIDNKAWTIAFWEKCDWTNTETSSPYILYWNSYIRIRKYSTTARLRGLFYYKDSEGTLTSALPYFMDSVGTDTSWKHFAMIFDGSAIKVYLNGTYIRLVALSSGFLLYDITGNLVLNYTAETTSKSLSDFRVYTTALSADDVAELYNLGASIS